MKSKECHNHKSQPRGRGKKHKSSRAKLTNTRKVHRPALSSLSEVITIIIKKKTAKHENKTHGKTLYKSPRRIHHRAMQILNNTRSIALKRSEEETTADFKAFLHLTIFTLGPDAPLNKKYIKLRSHNGSQLCRCIIAKT